MSTESTRATPLKTQPPQLQAYSPDLRKPREIKPPVSETRPESCVIRGIALDEQCRDCDGHGLRGTYTVVNGRRIYDFTPDGNMCRTCDGRGYVLTDEGETLVAFIRRHRAAVNREAW